MSTELLSSPVPGNLGAPAWPPSLEIPDNITCSIHSILSSAPVAGMLSKSQGTGTPVFSFLIVSRRNEKHQNPGEFPFSGFFFKTASPDSCPRLASSSCRLVTFSFKESVERGGETLWNREVLGQEGLPWERGGRWQASKAAPQGGQRQQDLQVPAQPRCCSHHFPCPSAVLSTPQRLWSAFQIVAAHWEAVRHVKRWSERQELYSSPPLLKGPRYGLAFLCSSDGCGWRKHPFFNQ